METKKQTAADKIYVGGQLQNIRIAKGITQQEMAEKPGCSIKTLSKFENGTDHLKIGTLFRMADILGISVDEVLPGRLTVSGNSFLSDFFTLTEANQKIVKGLIRLLKEQESANG